MKKIFLSVILSLSSLGAAVAQSATGVPAIDQFVAAANRQSVEGLRPYLTADTRVDALPAAYTPQVLAQLLPKFGPVEGARLVRQEAAGANTRYVCALTRKGAEKECIFLLTPAGQLLEINLAMASAKKIDTAFSPQSLTTPPRVDASVRLVNGLLLVEAEVDGRRGTFVLDSGAPALLLNQREFAAPAGQAAAAVGGAQGVNGGVGGVSYHAVKSFNWAGIAFQNKDVATLDLSDLGQKLGGIPLLGLIGSNLLTQYALTLDYHAARVLLRKPDGSAPGPRPLLSLPFVLRGHLPVVEVTANGQVYRLAVDCGAQANLLDQRYEPAFAAQLRKPTKTALAGADEQRRTVTSGQIPELRLGTLAFRNQQTVFSDISHLNQDAGKAALQGLLGYPFLSQYRTTIDYVNQQIYFFSW
ncbi:MAG: retropepsin-like domain-containing protein [Hymenobacter sp.]|nr:retropepsin-like domain-containing protein [Hymenobacter sp.]